MIKEWVFPPMRQGYYLSPLVFNLTDGFSQCIKAIWEVKGIYNGKEVKLFLFADDMMISAKKSERIYKNASRTNNCI